MASAGLWMLALLAALVVATGLPVWALLVGVASLFAALGVALSAFDSSVLSAVYPRLTNLLEMDLLQAMPLYVFIGVLLQRLPVADALFGAFARALRPTRAAPSLAALALGALVAPMNGSVASSSALLARLVAPRLTALPAGRGVALVAAAATVGVVVPPSLVLLFLGDAMMRAHTEAANLAGAASALATQRIVNTQDVLHAALLPAALVLLLWALAAWWQGRGREHEVAPLPLRRLLLAVAATLGILALLAAVFTGRLFAVEGAATGGCVLAVLTLVTRTLDRAAWRAVLLDTLALSGALFAVLAGATTFSLVFGLFGTGPWLAQLTQASSWPPAVLAACLLAGVAACAWVLDAFEMIFVIVPVVGPLLVLRLGDAQQAAVLLLLVLQLSFLLPPMGYAVLMAQARSGLAAGTLRVLLGALAPYLAGLLLVLAAVFAFPVLVHKLDEAPAATQQNAPPESEEDLVRRMREMSQPEEPAPTPTLPQRGRE
ncbi:TRAP transporter large permease subunit [Ramlibacter sp. G-1-2-2]|uniref:TRAP transporter large permease subunit n=1 Tax=Ramlibacter agri TaxID=2728837 RepID=A0A848H843_9BURK|nr:TRAP transporter large permease subunit [Ramlibacter agri]NML45641.1 TRAP transporter large permease subunit [Ramlibacter agri]